MQHHHRAYMLKEDELDNQHTAEASFSNGSELVRQLKQGKPKETYDVSVGQLPRTSGKKRCEPPTSLFHTSQENTIAFCTAQFPTCIRLRWRKHRTQVEKTILCSADAGTVCSVQSWGFVPPLRRVSLGIGRVPCRTDCQVKGWRRLQWKKQDSDD